MDKDGYHGYDKDAEIKRLNEKIEFLARTNMLYSDWEHRNTQVTSDLIRKGIEGAKINAELRAEIERLKSAPPQRPWVRMTDERQADLWEASRAGLPRFRTYATLIEKELRILNT